MSIVLCHVSSTVPVEAKVNICERNEVYTGKNEYIFIKLYDYGDFAKDFNFL